MATWTRDRGYGEWHEQKWNNHSYDQERERRMDHTEKRVARAPETGQAAKASMEVFEMRNVQNMPEDLGPDTRQVPEHGRQVQGDAQKGRQAGAGRECTERGGEGQ